MKTLHKQKNIMVIIAVLLLLAGSFAVAYPEIYTRTNKEDIGYTVYNSDNLKAEIMSCIRYLEIQDYAGSTNLNMISESKMYEIVKDYTPVWKEYIDQYDESAQSIHTLEELKEEDKKDAQNEIDKVSKYMYKGYQATYDWIKSVPSLCYYIKNETTGKVITNNKELGNLNPERGCEETEFKDYDFLMAMDIKSNALDAEALVGPNYIFRDDIELAYSGIQSYHWTEEATTIMRWADYAGQWTDHPHRTIYIGVKDKSDLDCLNTREYVDPSYKWHGLLVLYGVEALLMLGFFIVGKRQLKKGTFPLVEVQIPVELILLAELAVGIFLPAWTVKKWLDLYSWQKNIMGGISILLSLGITVAATYELLRLTDQRVEGRLLEQSLCYKVYRYILYRRENPDIKMEREWLRIISELLLEACGWTLGILFVWYMGTLRLRTYLFSEDNVILTACHLIMVLLLIGVWVVFNKKRKKAQLDYHGYCTLVESTKAIASGEIGIRITEELGKYNALRDAINHINEGLSKAVDEAVKSQSMKTELITNVSHDLKTPLTSIVSYVDLLKRKDLADDEKREYVEILEQKSARLKTLIEDLFEMSKAASHDVTLSCTELNIVSLTREVLVEQEPAMDKKDLKVNMSYISDSINVNLDAQKTYRIISNLVSNITKYTMPHTRVYVAITKDETEVMLEFKNISATELTRQGEELTERFVRGDQSRNTEGSGLGLAIAKSLTEVQKGTFKVEADGDLFKVRITFPLAN